RVEGVAPAQVRLGHAEAVHSYTVEYYSDVWRRLGVQRRVELHGQRSPARERLQERAAPPSHPSERPPDRIDLGAIPPIGEIDRSLHQARTAGHRGHAGLEVAPVGESPQMLVRSPEVDAARREALAVADVRGA